MSGTGLAAQLGVIIGARVGVLDNRGDGRAGGMSIDNTGDDVGGVGLAAFGRGLGARGGGAGGAPAAPPPRPYEAAKDRRGARLLRSVN